MDKTLHVRISIVNNKMDSQYFPRGPAPMIRERELAENCLRNVFQAPEILRDRTNFLRYMDQITNEVLGIQQEKVRKEQEAAVKKINMIQQQQIRQTITDDMRMASSTSLDKLRHLRESMRENTVGVDNYSSRYGHSIPTDNHGYYHQQNQPQLPQQPQLQQQQAFQYPQNNPQSSQAYPPVYADYGINAHDYPESHQQTYNPYASIQERQAHQAPIMSNPTQDYQYLYYHPEEIHQQQQLTAPPSRAQTELMQETSPLKQGDTKPSSPPKPIENNSTPSCGNPPLQPNVSVTISNLSNIPVSPQTKFNQFPQQPQSTGLAMNKSTPIVSTIPSSNINAGSKTTGIIGGSQSGNYTPASAGMGNFDPAAKTPMPPSKAITNSALASNTQGKLTLPQAAVQPSNVSSSNSVSAEPSPSNQLHAPGTNTSSTGSRRRFSIGEEDWDEEGSAFTPTSPKLLGNHRKSISSNNNKIIPSPARRPSTDSSPGKISGTSTPALNAVIPPQSPPTTANNNVGISNNTSNASTVIKPPIISLERPLSAGKARSGNTATVLATAAAPVVTSAMKDTGHNISYNNISNGVHGLIRSQHTLSGDQGTHGNPNAAVSTSIAPRSASPAPLLPPKPLQTTSVKSTATNPPGTGRDSSRSSDSSDEFSDLEDIDGDESHANEDVHSETLRSLMSEKVQPPLSAAMMVSVINHSHPQLLQLTSRNNSDSDNRNAQQHKIPLQHPPVPRPLTPMNIGCETSMKVDNMKGKDADTTGEVDLSWEKLRDLSLQNKRNDSPNNNNIATLPNFLPHSGHTIAAEVAVVGSTMTSKLTLPEETEKIVAAEYARLSRELEALKHKIPGARLPAIVVTQPQATFNLPPLYSDRDYAHVAAITAGSAKNTSNITANNLNANNGSSNNNNLNNAVNNTSGKCNINNNSATHNNSNEIPIYPSKRVSIQNNNSNTNTSNGDAMRESIDLSSLSLQRIRELTGHY